jgi:nucleotide-binding universal stress UspA family protein
MSLAQLEQKQTATLRPSAEGVQVIILATDGTPQSEPAIAFVRALSKSAAIDVKVITVVRPLPAGSESVDPALFADIERTVKAAALEKVRKQVGAGQSTWQIEVDQGDPARRISDIAAESAARLIVVGLGEHGAAARLFGSETALRLARTSRTPLLAVAPELQAPPRRILVAMDFSEASIEAARLALDIAAKNATMVLAHCVSWERPEYVPEKWFAAHERVIATELKSVLARLGADRCSRISYRILYGTPSRTLLAYAGDLRADLIVAGTHGRSRFGRLVAGETVGKLIRGAPCSVLVLPAAAAFRLSNRLLESAVAAGGISWTGADKQHWGKTLDDFSRRNAGRCSRLEVDDTALGAQTEMSGYRFQGASYEPGADRASLMFGGDVDSKSHLVRGITGVTSVEVFGGDPGRPDRALSIGHDGGQTLVLFDSPKSGEV